MSVMKAYREKRKLTQEALGKAVGKVEGIRGVSTVSKGYISQIENSKDNCADWLALAIAAVLRCDVDTLFKTVVERKSRYVVRKR